MIGAQMILRKVKSTKTTKNKISLKAHRTYLKFGSGRTAAHLSSLCKTANYNVKMTNTVLRSSRLHRCSIICRISPASGGLVPRHPSGALSLDPNGGTSILRLPDEPPFPKSLIRSCLVIANSVDTYVTLKA